MDVRKAIETRRAFRSLVPVDIDEVLVNDLAECASLAPSCFNNQPWRYAFVYGERELGKLFAALSRGNEWARNASLVIAVYSGPDLDCRIKGRDYYFFDTGIATGLMVLRATELGLVAHPIAGFDEGVVKKTLGLPGDMTVITLVIVGKHAEEIDESLSEKQIEAERARPTRLDRDEFALIIV
jgi:nitroreductase